MVKALVQTGRPAVRSLRTRCVAKRSRSYANKRDLIGFDQKNAKMITQSLTALRPFVS